jgi:hypothetical protein
MKQDKDCGSGRGQGGRPGDRGRAASERITDLRKTEMVVRGSWSQALYEGGVVPR